MTGCLDYCARERIWLDLKTRRAVKWLERHGYQFRVDFGYANACDRMWLAKAEMARPR